MVPPQSTEVASRARVLDAEIRIYPVGLPVTRFRVSAAPKSLASAPIGVLSEAHMRQRRGGNRLFAAEGSMVTAALSRRFPGASPKDTTHHGHLLLVCGPR